MPEVLRKDFLELFFQNMHFSKWRDMDAHLLVGLVNTELRNHSESLDDFLKTHDIDEKELVEKLGNAGYVFREEQKQFRA
jgi:hypothetical protein